MSRNVWLLFVGLTFVATSGCSGSSKKGPPPKVAVKGTVTLDGKPIPDGEILFTVQDEAPQPLPIKDGSFSGEAMTGKNRVEIRAFKSGPPPTTDPKGPPSKINIVPDKYNGKSTLTAEIPADGASSLKFEVTSK